METGKPDDIGKVGEEALGPLTLPRPGSGYLSDIVRSFFIGGFGFFAIRLANLFSQHFGWTKKYADNVSYLSVAAAFIIVTRILPLFWRRPDYRLSIKRGTQTSISSNVHIEISSNVHIEIWSNPSKYWRALPAVLSIFCGIGMLFFLAIEGDSWFERLAGVSIFLLCVYKAFQSAPTVSSPLIAIDHSGVILNGRFTNWHFVQRVDIEHSVDFFGSFNGVKLIFRGENQRKIGGALLPKDQISVAQEKNLLEFIARVLGREVKTVAHHSPN